eukprot:m.143787 g.143787  ORF g.143787 m.143787 type:complete len:432 (-) comp16748_c0_seq2:15-1310(-)
MCVGLVRGQSLQKKLAIVRPLTQTASIHAAWTGRSQKRQATSTVGVSTAWSHCGQTDDTATFAGVVASAAVADGRGGELSSNLHSAWLRWSSASAALCRSSCGLLRFLPAPAPPLLLLLLLVLWLWSGVGESWMSTSSSTFTPPLMVVSLASSTADGTCTSLAAGTTQCEDGLKGRTACRSRSPGKAGCGRCDSLGTLLMWSSSGVPKMGGRGQSGGKLPCSRPRVGCGTTRPRDGTIGGGGGGSSGIAFCGVLSAEEGTSWMCTSWTCTSSTIPSDDPLERASRSRRALFTGWRTSGRFVGARRATCMMSRCEGARSRDERRTLLLLLLPLSLMVAERKPKQTQKSLRAPRSLPPSWRQRSSAAVQPHSPACLSVCLCPLLAQSVAVKTKSCSYLFEQHPVLVSTGSNSSSLPERGACSLHSLESVRQLS